MDFGWLWCVYPWWKKKDIQLWWMMLITGEAMHVWEQKVCGKSLYFSLNFIVNKTTLKTSVFRLFSAGLHYERVMVYDWPVMHSCELLGQMVQPNICEKHLWAGADPVDPRETWGRAGPQWRDLLAPCLWGVLGRMQRGEKGWKKKTEMRLKWGLSQICHFSKVFWKMALSQEN